MQEIKPNTRSTAPHHTLACKLNKTTPGSAGGFTSWKIPAAKINAPFTASETPMKNQIEIMPRTSIQKIDLPEINVQYEKNDGHHAGPEKGFLVQGDVPNRGNFRQPVYQTR